MNPYSVCALANVALSVHIRSGLLFSPLYSGGVFGSMLRWNDKIHPRIDGVGDECWSGAVHRAVYGEWGMGRSGRGGDAW